MAEAIQAGRVQELLSNGASVLEVLPEDEYREQHIRGAINVPLKKLDAGAVSMLNRDRPVIVYCWDSI
jgi:rhodanese-related sulfurtransferase